MPDIKKETVKAIKLIDYARLREYPLQKLLTYELTTTSFSLTKDGFLCKSAKSELARKIEENVQSETLTEMPKNTAEIKSMVVIDFMAQVRKVPVKKAKIRTFGEFGQFLWKHFQYLGNECEKIDIIFDLYLDSSMKHGERQRRVL